MLSSYNLFRRKLEPDLCCAIPQDKPIPAFVDGNAWEFAGTVTDTGPRMPAGFKRSAAPIAVSLTGYYVFHALPESMERRGLSRGGPEAN